MEAAKNVQVMEPSPRTQPAQFALTPMDMIDRAVASGAGIEVLEKLMSLQERWDANNARKAFDEAMAAAKAEIPVIFKNREVDFTGKTGLRTHYRHEDLSGIARQVDPILTKHGLSYRFRTSSVPNEPVNVTCIVTHRLGHSEENSLSAGRDESGNKNSIQAIGSTITYLQRYTLKAALGLSASTDDDAKAAGETDDHISEAQVAEIEKLIKDTGGDVAKFCTFAKVEKLGDIFANRFEAAKAAVIRAAEQRKQAAK